MTGHNPTLPESREIETVLIIRDSSETVFKQIADRHSIQRFRLDNGPTRTIRDRYYDTLAGTLRRRRVNFRLREIDGVPFLSIKSNPRRTLRGATLRKEVEVPWSSKAFEDLARELGLELNLGSNLEGVSEPGPDQLIESRGLGTIQDRETQRQVRYVSLANSPTRKLAELAIDRVTYHIGTQDITILEVEVEEKARGSSVVSDLSKALVNEFKPSLKMWGHGKLITGLGLQNLLKTDSVDGLLDRGSLRPEAIDRLDKALRSSQGFWGWTLLRMLDPR